MKTLTIKTATNTIYVSNGKVTIVRDNSTGRFVKPARFANIVNNLIAASKAAHEVHMTSSLFANHTVAAKLVVTKFANLSKIARQLLGDMLVYLNPRRATGLSTLAFA